MLSTRYVSYCYWVRVGFAASGKRQHNNHRTSTTSTTSATTIFYFIHHRHLFGRSPLLSERLIVDRLAEKVWGFWGKFVVGEEVPIIAFWWHCPIIVFIGHRHLTIPSPNPLLSTASRSKFTTPTWWHHSQIMHRRPSNNIFPKLPIPTCTVGFKMLPHTSTNSADPKALWSRRYWLPTMELPPSRQFVAFGDGHTKCLGMNVQLVLWLWLLLRIYGECDVCVCLCLCILSNWIPVFNSFASYVMTRVSNNNLIH